ncbi:hypothetical protein KXV92_006898 [Aspergillus fumigatus]|nr:hypothetical protein KXW88_002777 [Aspergillus fumigatus]KAH2362459.1 hypothetical protein KXV98_005291 [Aspergillus fumigatus]KAH3183672.1 hypothetical protein KXV92_006898 [Aspergillus fumigatus]KAJ8225824.1 hypothetical protein LV156_009065 [Aspergillus fumigatus]KAJ8227802.1 hypothetical protein LV160_009010 [Aspergillus fumigatus]
MSLPNIPTDLRLEADSQTNLHCESSTSAPDRTPWEGTREDTRVRKSEEGDCVHQSFDEQIHLPREKVLVQLKKAITFFSALRGIPEPVIRSGDNRPPQIPFVELLPNSQVEGQVQTDTAEGPSRSNRVTIKTQMQPHTTASSASEEQPAKSTTEGHIFVCSFSHYGCTGTFASKNEWKRHIASIHVQLGFFRCDVGNCGHRPDYKTSSTSTHNHHDQPGHQPNDFNRKDLFTQHQRRMHAPGPDATAQEQQDFEASLKGCLRPLLARAAQAATAKLLWILREEFLWSEQLE